MSFWDRFRRRRDDDVRHDGETQLSRDQSRALSEEILGWVRSRPARDGVATQAWIEEPNDFNPPSILLVAPDGESRRWRIPDVPWAGDLCRRHRIEFFRAGAVAYPQRMRDYKERERAILRDLERGGPDEPDAVEPHDESR